jgi:predicted nucleic acid-binding protein
MQKVIISDTSCLVLLDKLKLLHLLNELYGTISVTPEIIEEFGDPLRIDFVVVHPKNSLTSFALSMKKPGLWWMALKL